MPFKLRFASGPIKALTFSGILILSPPYQLKKEKKVFRVELDHSFRIAFRRRRLSTLIYMRH